MMSLEFAGLPKNFDLLTPDLFGGKLIVLGCISTKPEVEDVEEIKGIVKRGVDLFGSKIILSSDCGFTKTPKDVVIRKMRNMVRVAREFDF
jgi:methionine synthase II (cobalamin-independent)